jgi:transposase
MVQIQLSDEELEAVKDIVARSSSARQLRRAQAIFWLSQGASVHEVAERLCVTRATIYTWVTRFEDRADLELADRLTDAARSGRPRTALGVIDPIIADLVGTDPRDFGFRQTVWTAGAIAVHLKRQHRIEVSIQSVGLAIDRLGVAWKRPRHQLALRPKTWRQSKGGSNAASKGGLGPSS